MKLYEYNGTEFSEEDIIAAAEEKGLSADEYIKKYNIKPLGEGEPGKKKPAAAKGAPVAGKKKGTASKPATTSSASKKVNPWETPDQAKKREATFGVGKIVQTPRQKKAEAAKKQVIVEEEPGVIKSKDLPDSEEEVKANMGSLASRYGLTLVETGAGDYITIRGAADNRLGKALTAQGTYTSIDLPAVKVGGGDANELKASAKKLNEYIELYGDKDFISKSKQKYTNKYTEATQLAAPKSRTFEEKLKAYNEDLASKFKNKENSIYDRPSGESMAASTMGYAGPRFTSSKKNTTLYEKDFSNADEYKAYQSWKKSGVIPIPSTAKLEAFIKQKNEDYREKKFTEYISDLDPEERVALSAINEDRKDFKVNVLAQGDALNARSIALNKKAEKAKTTPLTNSERIELMNEYTSLTADITLYDENIALVKKEAPMVDGIAKTALDDYNRLNQTLTGLKSIAADVTYGAADLIASGLAATQGMSGKSYTERKSMLKPLLLDPIYGLKKDLSREGESYQRDLHIGEITGAKDFGRWGASVLTQMPASLSLAVTGEFAMPLFFLSGYGGKAYENAYAEQAAIGRLEKNMELLNSGEVPAEDMSELQKQIANDKKILAIPEGAKVTSQLLAGAAEVVFERLGSLNIIKKTKHALDLIPPAEIKASLKQFVKESFKSMPIEGGTEALTQVANNFGDIVLLGQDKNMFTDVPDAFAGGAFMGPGFAAGGGMNNIAKALASEITTRAELKQREAKLKEVQKLTGLQDITGLTVREVNKLKLNPEVKKAVNELIGEMDGEDLKILDRLGKDFSIADAKKIGDFNMELRKTLKEWATASKNGELSDSELKTLKDYYENKYNTTLTQREALLNNEQLKAKNRTESTKKRVIFAMAEGTSRYNYRLTQKARQKVISDFGKLGGSAKQPYYDKAAEELKSKSDDPNFTPKKSEIASKAKDIYTDEKLGERLREDIKNAQQYVTDQGLTTDMQVFDDAEADAKSLKVAADVYGKNSDDYKNVVKSIKNKTFNGLNAGGRVVIHVPNSIRNGKTSVGSHEVLHSVVADALKNNQTSANKAGFALFNYLEQEQPDLHAVVSTQMTAYDESNPAYGEEIMNALSDSFSDGGVPSDPVLTQISKMLYKISKGAIGIPENSIDTVSLENADGKAIYELIKSFHNVAGRAEKGKVKARILVTTPDEEDEAAMQAGAKLSRSIQDKMDELDDQLNNDEIDYDTYETKMDQLTKEEAKAIKLEKEKSVKQKEEKASTKTTLQDLLNKKYEGNKRKFISEGLTTTPNGKETFDFAKSDIGEQLGGLVESITRRLYDGIPADSKKTVSRTDYKNALITAAATLIDKEWDPSKQDLDKFISNRLNLRANSLAKELGIEGIQQGGIKSDVEQAKGLMAEETKQEVAEKPKYKTILESKVFKDEVVNSVKDKLAKELRTLKSKIDEPVSINKTITPLVAEIKDAMGKQADIDIKKALGGKPNNEFRSNILKNKKAILENMTTTWLMGKDTKKGVEGGIPAAIQKQVDGKWLSYPDWVGKKIDREKVTTNLAGKTSGADIVRRLPNAVNNVSDADFLSSFLAPNGDLIRGRKESLSKAMAEELSFDIFRQGLEEGGPIAEAFEKNQELKNVVLADSYINEVGKQLERGTVKFSMSIEDMQDQLQGMVMDFVENKNSDFVINMYPDEVVEVARKLGIISLFEEGPTGFKSQMKKLMESNPDMPGWDTYFATNTNKNSETSMDQLADFSSALMELLPPELLNSLPVDIFAMTYSYLDAAEQKQSGLPGKYNWLAKKFENLKSKESKEALPFNPAHIRLYNAGMGLMGRIATILEKPISADEKREMVNEKYGEEIANANAANKQALNYLFTKAAEVIAKDPSLTPGFLRWMESSTSNARGQRAFTGLELIEFLDGPQKNDDSHTLYASALEAATKDANKAYNNKSKKFRDSISKEDFIESYLANPNTGVNSKLRFKGEHVVAAANAMFELGKNALKASELIRKFPAAKSEILNNLELENIPILAGYEQTLGAKVHSDIQDEKLGTTSKLGYFRNLALEGEAFDGFKTVSGVNGSEFLKNKMLAFEKINEAINSRSIESIARDITFEKAIQKVAFSKSVEKIRVFDFDDTLARTKSNVLYTLPDDPKQYKIDAATFAKDGGALEKLGAKWDFSEFSKVMNGQKGPLFEVAKIIADKRGTDDVFVLTARPADSAGPIHEFLKELGLDIPVKNITGLGNSNPQAKADWIVGKAAEGYNDFYFADDHTGNVKAVKDALSVLDVKSKVQQAKLKFSKSIETIQAETNNGFLTKEQANDLEKEIEANYNANPTFGNENNDIRTSLFNYNNPIAQKTSNGVDLRITEGLVRNKNKTYLLYADGKITGQFNSVNEAKNIIKYIEDNLIKPSGIQSGNIKFSKSIDQQFNEIIETNKGIGAQKRYSGITSKRLGASKGRYKFFLPPGAEDFEGLLYNFLGKGKEGEAQAEFFERTLLAPYWEGVSAIESARQRIKRDFKALKKAFPNAAKKITERTPDGNFTYDQAIRVYLWTKEGKTIPELSRGDQARLNSLIANDPELAAFANGLELVSGRTGGWSDPSEFWDSDTIVSELNDMTEKVGRKTYLEEFIKNADEIFSNDNMNKIEAIYGTNIREALEGALYRMKNGKNQSMGSGKATAAVNAWVNGSVAEIMFLNTKSGVLQLISSLNYLNLRDNNPIMAGKALLNFPQFAKDFATIFNSDMMKERRQGLKEDVSAAEIANAAATSKNKVRAISAYLAKIGFTPTTIADALAIGMGGAPFYRNRINTYKKQGMSEAEAEAKAWKDFTRLTNKSAQSNDPALISQIQAEPIGRIIFAFGNATMQMNRIMKKSARDLINGRGNPAEHVSKILFYGFIQNAIFSALQKAVFIGLFGDDDDEEKDKDKKKQKTAEEKAIELADDMLDSFLRGSGLAGAVVSTAKNVTQEYFKQRAKKAKGDQAYTLIAGLNISPSIGSKARKIYGAIQEEKFNRAVIERMGGKVMLDGRFNPSPIYNVGAKVIAAATNKPADRLLDKITNISEALDARNENWQRAMLMLGYKPFELGVENEEQDAIKAQAKIEREDEVFIEGIEKKKAKIKKLRSMTPEDRKAYTDSIKATIPAKIERAKRRRKLLYGK